MVSINSLVISIQDTLLPNIKDNLIDKVQFTLNTVPSAVGAGPSMGAVAQNHKERF